MRIPKGFGLFLMTMVCILLLSSRASAQGAYGYASIDVDPSTNMATGYASTELDYETAAYYDAEVQAQIEDDSGNILTTGSARNYQSASVILTTNNIVQCITYRIISYILLDLILFNDCGYVDVFGFGYFPYDTYWGYGYWWGERTLCRWEPYIRLAQLIETVIECTEVAVSCTSSSLQILPSLDLRGTPLRQNKERQFIAGTDANTGRNNATITCSANDTVTGQPVSNVLIGFRFNPQTVVDDGGHQNHAGARPPGSLSITSARTDGSGLASTVLTASPFGGTTDIGVTANGSDAGGVDIYVMVPGLSELQGGNNYRLIGTNNYHPVNHWVKSDVVTSMQQIADDYAGQVYPNGFPQHAAEPNDGPNDYYKLHYNDCSLRLGGKFDLGTQRQPIPRWDPNARHDEHRVGINCDVREFNVPNDTVTVNGQTVRRWDKVEDIFFQRGSTQTTHETNPRHWHLRFYRGTQVAASEDLSPFNGSAATIPGQIEAEEFDIGSDGNAFSVPPPADPNDEVGTSAETYDASDGSTALMSDAGQWTAYTVSVDATDTYTLIARVASPNSGSAFHVEMDGVNKTGPIYIPNTGSWDSYQMVSLDNISLEAGQHVMTVVIESGGGDVDYLGWSLYRYQSCQPSSAQLNACWRHGGDWDYDLCYCVYY